LRKLLIPCLVAVGVLVFTAVALAVTVQHFNASFTTKKTGKPAGTKLHFDSNDSANTGNNQQPASSKEVDVSLPSGTVLNQKAVPTCSASDSDFNTKGQNACPSKTQVGHQKPKCHVSGAAANCSGHASVRLRFGTSGAKSDIPARIYAYNGKNKTLILYIVPNGANPIVLRPKLKSGKTVTLVTKIPVLCALGTPPNCGTAGEARLDSFDLTIDKISKKGKVFITTPTKCPSSKNWVFKTVWHYRPATGTEPPQPASDSKTAKSPCV
jgi:hypothetical protein